MKTTKPLTKALHTVRVIEVIARHLVATSADRIVDTPRDLFAAVLIFLGNAAPEDKALHDACVAICAKVLS